MYESTSQAPAPQCVAGSTGRPFQAAGLWAARNRLLSDYTWFQICEVKRPSSGSVTFGDCATRPLRTCNKTIGTLSAAPRVSYGRLADECRKLKEFLGSQ